MKINNLTYLFGMLFVICIFLEKTIIHDINSTFFGRILLFSSVGFITLYDTLGGFMYGFFMLCVLNINYLETFENSDQKPVKHVKKHVKPVKSDTKIDTKIDREKEEKKIITPKLSNEVSTNVPLHYDSNESGIILPSSSTNNELDYSPIN